MIFTVWCPEYGQQKEDGKKFSAVTAEEAAQAWAFWRDWDSNDYKIVGGEIPEVFVQGDSEVQITKLYVRGETLRSYHAKRIS